MTSAGGVVRARRAGCSSAHRPGRPPRASSTPSLVWQMSAGHRLKLVAAAVDVDRVEILAAEHLDAGDVAAARRDELLHQRGAVEPEVDAALGDRAREIVGRVEADDAGAAAADVGLDDHREAQALGRRRRLVGMVDHARRRERQAERLQQRQLQRLRRLDAERRQAVDDAHAELLEVGEVVQRVEDAVAAAAQVRRRAHAVEHEPVLRAVAVGRVVGVPLGVQRLVGHAAAIELGEQRPEPVRVLVVDADRSCGCHAQSPVLSMEGRATLRDCAGNDEGPESGLAFRASF